MLTVSSIENHGELVVALIEPLQESLIKRFILGRVEVPAFHAVVKRIFGAFEMIEVQRAQPGCLVEKARSPVVKKFTS